MGIYLIILFLFFFFSILNVYIKKDVSLVTKIYFLEFVILWLLGGLRYGVGMDYFSYQDLYSMSYKLYEMPEGGFAWLVEFFNSCGFSYAVFNLFLAFCTLLLAFRFIQKRSPYPFFSILFYFSIGNFYFSSLNAVRQALATVIFLNILELVEKRKFFLYALLLVLTAYFVHATALILIPLYFFLQKDWGEMIKLLVLAGIAFFNSIVLVLIEFSSYANYLRYEDYATDVPMTYYFMGLISILAILYSWKNSNWKKQNYIILNLNFVMIALIYLIFVYENTPLVMVINRLLGYFTLICVVLLPLLYNEMALKTNRFVLILLTSCMLVTLSYMAISRNGETNNIVPYKTIFSE